MTIFSVMIRSSKTLKYTIITILSITGACYIISWANRELFTIIIYGVLHSATPKQALDTQKHNVVSLIKLLNSLKHDPWIDNIKLVIEQYTIHILVFEKIPLVNLFCDNKYQVMGKDGKIVDGQVNSCSNVVGKCSTNDIMLLYNYLNRSIIKEDIQSIVMVAPNSWCFHLKGGQIILTHDLELLNDRLTDLFNTIDLTKLYVIDLRASAKILYTRK